MHGMFLTIEGVEGCGKSTQVALLDEFLRGKGFETLVARDPGGTSIGEVIRELLLSPDSSKMTPVCELLLFAAARAQLVREIIRPAVASGTIVLSDRFSASTYAYQGIGLGVGEAAFDAADGLATDGRAPDLTIILDLSPAEGMRRKGRALQDGGDRIEQRSMAFHQRVRDGYLSYARRHPERVVVLNGGPPVDVVHRQVIAAVEPMLAERGNGKG